MTTVEYKGYKLVTEQKGPQQQTLIYKDDNPISGTFSELDPIDSYNKAILRVDCMIDGRDYFTELAKVMPSINKPQE